MNIFNKITLKGLKRSRTRTIVTIIGVILSVSMITAVTAFISSFQAYLIKGVIAQQGDWQGAFTSLDAESAEKIKTNPAIKEACLIQNIGYAPFQETGNAFNPYFFIAGFEKETFDMLPIKLTSGRLPEKEGEILLSSHALRGPDAEYTIGSTLTLEIGTRIFNGKLLRQMDTLYTDELSINTLETFEPEMVKTYTITGICERPFFEPAQSPGYTLITLQQAESADGSYDLYYTMNDPSSIYPFSANMPGTDDPSVYHSELLNYLGISNDSSFKAMLYSLGAVLILLIMAGSILLIYNSFSISVSERTRQFGILSSVGATKKQLRRSVLFEGFYIGLLGILPGILIGLAGTGLTLRFAGGTFDAMIAGSGIPLSLTPSLPAIAAAAAIGMITILLSAYIPARKASKHSAIDSIRQTDDIKISAKKLRIPKVVQNLFGLEGTLALKNLKRNKKRCRSTIISLFASVVLFISASAFSIYLKQSSSLSIKNAGYDLLFPAYQLQETEALKLYEALRHAEKVTGSSYYTRVTVSGGFQVGVLSDKYREYYGLDGGSDSEMTGTGMFLFFMDDDTYLQYIEELGLPKEEYTGENASFPASAKIHTGGVGERYGSYDIFKAKDLRLLLTERSIVFGMNDSGAQTAGISIHVTFVEEMPKILSETLVDGTMIAVPYSMKAQLRHLFTETYSPDMTFQSSDPMQSEEDMHVIIQKVTGFEENEYSLVNMAEELEENRRIILAINLFTYGFILLISLIATANVLNTISTGIGLRRREFAMLRSVGLTDAGFRRMMHFECLFYGLKALLYGLPAAIAVTYLIYLSVLNEVNVSFYLPWKSIGISIFSVFFVVFITMLYAVGKIKHANIIDALKEETV